MKSSTPPYNRIKLKSFLLDFVRTSVKSNVACCCNANVNLHSPSFLQSPSIHSCAIACVDQNRLHCIALEFNCKTKSNDEHYKLCSVRCRQPLIKFPLLFPFMAKRPAALGICYSSGTCQINCVSILIKLSTWAMKWKSLHMRLLSQNRPSALQFYFTSPLSMWPRREHSFEFYPFIFCIRNVPFCRLSNLNYSRTMDKYNRPHGHTTQNTIFYFHLK